MAHEAGALELPVRRLEEAPPRARTLVLALLVVGVVALAAALLTGAERAWRAYLFNWLYFTSIAQGAVILSAVTILARGIWAQPIRRIALSFAAFLPVAFVLMIPLLIAGTHVFPWMHEDVGPKAAYLNLPFLAARTVVAFGILVGLSLLFAAWALRPDAGLLQDEVSPRLRDLYRRLSGGWRGQEEEERVAYHRLRTLGPVLVIAYALAFTILAFDFVMSLEPHWKSTLIGPYVFMSAFLGGIAATALATTLFRPVLALEDYITPPHLHDLGKMLFAFCVFWAYLSWAQYIVIWYGLLPAEQLFPVKRLTMPYAPLAILVLFCLFVIPFFGLLGVYPKKNPDILRIFAGVVLFGLWIERYMLIYPSYNEYHEEIIFGWQEVGIGLGFASLLIASLLFFAARFPMLQLWQPWYEMELLGPGKESIDEVVTAE